MALARRRLLHGSGRQGASSLSGERRTLNRWALCRRAPSRPKPTQKRSTGEGWHAARLEDGGRGSAATAAGCSRGTVRIRHPPKVPRRHDSYAVPAATGSGLITPLGGPRRGDSPTSLLLRHGRRRPRSLRRHRGHVGSRARQLRHGFRRGLGTQSTRPHWARRIAGATPNSDWCR